MAERLSGSEDLGDIAAEIVARRVEIADRVVGDWYGVREVEPWVELPSDLDHDHLPDLIATLAAASLRTFFQEAERDRLVWAAIEHGAQRHADGYGENLIYREYTQLRRALWSEVRERFAATGKASAAVLRLDAAISLALGGSLRGFYRETLEASGEWPRAIEQLSRDFSFGGEH